MSSYKNCLGEVMTTIEWWDDPTKLCMNLFYSNILINTPTDSHGIIVYCYLKRTEKDMDS